MSYHLVVGMGEIGKAVKGIFPAAQTLDLDKKSVELPVDIMHICFPYSISFDSQVRGYMKTYNPTHVIIWSTVQVGTTAKLPGAVHSPVEGKHPDLELSIRTMTRWIGHNDEDEGKFFARLFYEVGISSKLVPNSDFTEALKLISTTEYGINIEFARYKAWVADQLGMDYNLTKEWNEEYNKLYKNLGLDKRFQKFVLDAPKGPKGGHCVTPNAVLLNEQFPNELVKIVGEL